MCTYYHIYRCVFHRSTTNILINMYLNSGFSFIYSLTSKFIHTLVYKRCKCTLNVGFASNTPINIIVIISNGNEMSWSNPSRNDIIFIINEEHLCYFKKRYSTIFVCFRIFRTKKDYPENDVKLYAFFCG